MLIDGFACVPTATLAPDQGQHALTVQAGPTAGASTSTASPDFFGLTALIVVGTLVLCLLFVAAWKRRPNHTGGTHNGTRRPT
jgi:hypothetical protein